MFFKNGTKNNLRPVIFVDKEKCVNCHRCITVCPVKICNNGAGDFVTINHDLCIGCGHCIEACSYGARKGIDDFDDFMKDVSTGTKMVAIVAPAVVATFKGQDKELNGWLKSLGVKAVFDVSFGAELTTKSYVEYIKSKNPNLVIAQPCPALVSYCEIYKPNLLKYLAPADSPMAHTMKMIREYYRQYDNCKIAVISPCYAKRREYDEIGLGDYNVTMKSISEYFKSKNISLSRYPKVDYDNPEAERAVMYSTPGGLMQTAERFVPGISSQIRKIEGQPEVYEYFDQLSEAMESGKKPLYKVIDCLNCKEGCNAGAGTDVGGMSLDEIESYIEQRKEEQKNIWKTKKSNIFSLKKLEKTVNNYWKPSLYGRTYKNHNDLYKTEVKEPTESQAKEIYVKMEKYDKVDFLDCRACGYDTCHQMAVAIFNGLNKPENCHLYKSKLLAKIQEEETQKLYDIVEQVRGRTLKEMDVSDDGVNEIEHASDEMVESMNTSSAAIEEMIANIQSINTILEGNTGTMVSLENATKVGQTGIDEVTKLVEEIEQKSKALNEMSLIIQQIANQTNLLSMNAAIEAAHAGESGKGFSVVADEIRKLAESSGSEAKMISDMLKNVNQLINSIFTKTVSVQKEIENIVSLSGEVNRQEDIVRNAISEQNEGGQLLLNALQVMKDKTGSVTDSIEHLRNSTEKIKEHIRDMSF
ncbi:MAG: 4Fe-4S binding protein [Spirochaetales bacterium]|nr:4Fe-4S binding protein [Spirochaetales bacterium]